MYKIDKLLKLNQKIFHTQDLRVLWGLENKNTLYTAIKRYVQKGILVPIQKGYYATVPIATLDPVVLGVGFLHRYAYLSCESILFSAGVISQPPQAITLVSSVSKTFLIAGHRYLCRRLAPRFLNQTAGITQIQTIFTASLERAVADLLYFNPRYHFDNRTLVNWPRVKAIQKEVGYL